MVNRNKTGDEIARDNCSVYLSISWLKSLRALELISPKEYETMVDLTIKHYDSDIRY